MNCSELTFCQIGEVARVVHYLKKHLLNKRIASVQVQDDNIVYGKVGTTAAAFQAAMTGKTVLDARQQGKYFWLVMDSAPHPVMHLGMTGWIKFLKDDTSFYRPKKEDEEWPPRFWKFIFKTEEGDEAAFVDPRRLARIRLVDADGDNLRKTSPLKENGPDPVIDKDILTLEWFSTKMRSKRVPVKALLLDQANISGVGNWVADEVLYQARTHPEQYSNTFSDEQLKTIHESLLNVCTTACDLLAESDKFPENWLMKYRWDKGKKGEVNKLPNGDKIVHLKVGGRTSAVVPSVQKKTGNVAGEVSASEMEASGEDAVGGDEVVAKGKKRKTKVEEESGPAPKRGRKAKAVKEESTGGTDEKEEITDTKKRGGSSRAVKQEAEGIETADAEDSTGEAKVATVNGSKNKTKTGTRRSGRLSGK